jgi:glycosyltransferase 2 family protein
MRRVQLLLVTTLGLALGFYLVMYVGWRAVLAAALTVGWGGFALLCLCAVGLFALLGIAWSILLPAAGTHGAWVFVRARMVRDSAAEVLPVSQLGGIALGVRAAILQGVAAPLASASMIVDVTAEMVAQIGYAALGVTILVTRVPQTSAVASLTRLFAIGLAVAAAAAVGFIVVQRCGEWFATRLFGPRWRRVGYTVATASALAAIYRSPLRIAASGMLHFTAWIANAGASWIAFRLVGAHAEVSTVIAIESLVFAARSAGAFVPNALGVQEGAYMLLAPLFGVGVELALAVSMLKRARDFATGIPILLLWQAAEGRRVLGGGEAAAGSNEVRT